MARRPERVWVPLALFLAMYLATLEPKVGLAAARGRESCWGRSLCLRCEVAARWRFQRLLPTHALLPRAAPAMQVSMTVSSDLKQAQRKKGAPAVIFSRYCGARLLLLLVRALSQ